MANGIILSTQCRGPRLDELKRALMRLLGTGEPIHPFPLQPKTDLGAPRSSRKSPSNPQGTIHTWCPQKCLLLPSPFVGNSHNLSVLLICLIGYSLTPSPPSMRMSFLDGHQHKQAHQTIGHLVGCGSTSCLGHGGNKTRWIFVYSGNAKSFLAFRAF